MRFALIDGAKAAFPVHRLCRALGVSQSGYFAWRGRPACRRQRDDMVLLAHVRSAFALSNATYGSPRDDAGIAGRRPGGRSPPGSPADARQRPAGSAEAAVQADHGQPSRLANRAEPARSGLHGHRAQQEVGRRHLLRMDPRRLAVPGRRHRPVRTPGRWLGNRRSAASRAGSCRSAQSPDHAPSGSRADPSLRSRQPTRVQVVVATLA